MHSYTKYSKSWKAVLLFAFLIPFFAFIPCSGQGLTGKWNRISGKKFYTAEYSKSTGKSSEDISTGTDGAELVEFRADHSYIYTLTIEGIPPIKLTGTWSVSGDQLILKMDPKQENPMYNPKSNVDQPTNTYTVSGNKLTLKAIVPDNNPLKKNMKVEKLEENFVRL
jgi:hypothetical protein